MSRPDPPPRRHGIPLVHAAAGTLVLVLLAELVLRVTFPWDLLISFESGFMTDMLKLHNGLPLFGNPTDLDTAVYAPAQELLTYAVLRPLGLDLDVRFCRLVAVTVGFGAAALAAGITARGRARWLAFFAATLLVFRSFTADAPHPDHLHVLHAMVLLVLCVRATARGSMRGALVAMLFAALAPCVKIEAALAPVGAILALLLGHRWRARETLLIAGVGALAWTGAIGLVLDSPNARAFVREVVRPRAFGASPWNFLLFARGHLLLLGVLAVPSALRLLYAEPRPERQRFFHAWLWIGAAEMLPGIAGYFLSLSEVNAFDLIGVWLFLAVWPVVAGRYADDERGPLAVAVAVGLLLTLVPVRIPPSAASWDYCARLEQAIRADIQGGHPILLAQGTMPLIRAGATTVPRDRADAESLAWPDRLYLTAGFQDRLLLGRYFRVYANVPGYPRGSALARRYRAVQEMPASPFAPYLVDMGRIYMLGYRDYRFGWGPTMPKVTVFERKP